MKDTIKNKKLKPDLSLKKRMDTVCRLLSKSIKDPKPELIYFSEYQFLVSVVLSAHSTDKTVNRVMVPLYKKGFCIKTVLDMNIKDLEDIVKPVGLYKSKAKHLKELTIILHDKFKDKIPNNKQDLLSLPGVGVKTSSVILSQLYNQKLFPVDTHVFRVSRRLGFHSLEKKDVDKLEDILISISPSKYLPQAHHLFLLHGRYVCKSTNPKCSECVLNQICDFDSKSKSK